MVILKLLHHTPQLQHDRTRRQENPFTSDVNLNHDRRLTPKSHTLVYLTHRDHTGIQASPLRPGQTYTISSG
jgi:hypothetical protein